MIDTELHVVELGKVYYDTVSGFTGVAVSYTVYLHDPIRSVDLESHNTGGQRHVTTFSELRLAPSKPNAEAGQYL